MLQRVLNRLFNNGSRLSVLQRPIMSYSMYLVRGLSYGTSFLTIS